MAIDLATARSAGALAMKIDFLNAMIARIQNAITNNYLISNLTLQLTDANGGGIDSIPIGNLILADSQASLNVALTAYQSQLTDATTQLAAL